MNQNNPKKSWCMELELLLLTKVTEGWTCHRRFVAIAGSDNLGKGQGHGRWEERRIHEGEEPIQRGMKLKFYLAPGQHSSCPHVRVTQR